MDDLLEADYEGLFVTQGAITSSPGMSFLLATVGYFGPGQWHGYWEDLMVQRGQGHQRVDRRVHSTGWRNEPLLNRSLDVIHIG